MRHFAVFIPTTICLALLLALAAVGLQEPLAAAGGDWLTAGGRIVGALAVLTILLLGMVLPWRHGDRRWVALRAANAALSERVRQFQQWSESQHDGAAQAVATLQTLPAAVLTFSVNGNVEWGNPAASELFGYAPEALIGHPVGELLPALAGRLTPAEVLLINQYGSTVGRQRGGGQLTLDLAVSHATLDGTDFFTVLLRDETGRQQEWQTYFDLTDDLICLLQPKGTVCRANPAFVSLCATGDETIVGAGLNQVVHPDDTRQLARSLQSLKDSDDVHCSIEMRCRGADGDYRWLLWHLTKDVKADVVYAAGRDISELKELQHHLRDEANASDDAKSTFLSVMDHELRTPLNAILGFAQMLNETAVLEREQIKRRCVGQILSSGEQMLTLVNDVLELARLSGGDGSALRRCAAAELLGWIPGAAGQLCAGRNLHYDFTEDAGNCVIVADLQRLRRVIEYLLSNAVKFTETNGNIHVTASVLDGELLINVADDGEGIDPQYLERVFERFYQVDSSHRRRHAGTGMGLTLSRLLIERHGGRIWASSEGAGAGAQVAFALPVAAFQNQQQVADKTSELEVHAL